MNFKKLTSSFNKIFHSKGVWVYVYPIFVAITFIAISFSAVSTKTSTIDEKYHLVRGVMLLETGDLRLNQHHPYLFNMLYALPTLLITEHQIPSTNSELWQKAMKDEIAEEYVEINGGIQYFTNHVLIWPRLLATVVTGIFLIFFYTALRREFGIYVAAVATFLLAFSPTMIAHAPIIATDVPATMTIFISSWFLYMWIKYRKSHYLYIFVVFAFFSILTKYSAIMLLPIWSLFLFVAYYSSFRSKKIKYVDFRALGNSILRVSFLLFIWLLSLTMFYKFQIGTISDMTYGKEGFQYALIELEESYTEGLPRAMAAKAIYNVKYPFPQYVAGFVDNVMIHDLRGHPSFLLGEYKSDGWWYYFPVSFVLKETLATITLTIVALAIGIYLLAANWRKIPQSKLHNWLFVAVAGLLLLLSIKSSINIGIRHILPIYPFLFIFVATMLLHVQKRVKPMKLLTFLLATSVVSLLLAFPNYISYFNESIPSRGEGYKYLGGSSYDWEQDWNLLFGYKNADPENVRLDIDAIEGKKLLALRKVNFFKKKEAILSDRSKVLRWLYDNGEIEPYEEVGDTIIVFEVDAEEIDRLIPKYQMLHQEDTAEE